MSRRRDIFSNTASAIKKFWTKAPVNNGNAHHKAKKQDQLTKRKRVPVISKKNAAKIEKTLNALLENKNAVQSGKIKFINFFEVKEYFGSRWVVVEQIFINTVEDVIHKYTDPEDISFRYNQDDFVIIFSKASKEESLLKCQLIATEIKRLLDEYDEDQEELKKINTEHSVAELRQKDSGAVSLSNIDEQHSSADQSRADIIEPDKLKIKAPEKPRTTKNEKDKTEKSENETLDFHYIPLQKNEFSKATSFVVVANKTGSKNDDKIGSYVNLYKKLDKEQRAVLDNKILERSIDVIQSLSLTKLGKINLTCIVDYETLISGNLYNNYKANFKKSKEHSKTSFAFLIENIPVDATTNSLKQTVAKLRSFSPIVYACVEFNANIDLYKYVNAGFTGIGILIENKFNIDGLGFQESCKIITGRAKRYSLKSTIILNKNSQHMAQIIQNSGFDLVSGYQITDDETCPIKALLKTLKH